MPELAALQSRLGYTFRDESLLRLALTHPSLAHENGVAAAHNQRLEFLGDAVLQLVLTRELYERFPAFGEGALTKARARLVNRRALVERARSLEIGAHLNLSRGEEMTGGRERASALADALEALLGAVFLDGGFDVARQFIIREFSIVLGGSGTLGDIDNPKGELQELLQARSEHAPQYLLVSASGADHDRDFEYAVLHEGLELARGRGKNKKMAESEAARAALEKIRMPGT